MWRATRALRRSRLTAACVVLASLAGAGNANAGGGGGYFYAKGPKPIPDGHGSAKLRFATTLPMDVDPTIKYVSLSLRVNHPQTHELLVRLRRPDFQYMGSPQSSIPRTIAVSDRDTRGRNLGRGKCFGSNPGFAPARFTTLNDSGGPPSTGTPPPPLSSGIAPYAGVFAPSEPLADFVGYHAAPAPQSETWTLIVKDVRKKRIGKLLCGVLYLQRN